MLAQTELKLLAYLQEHSEGSGQRIGLDPKPIAKDLRIGPEQLTKDSSALKGHSLAGVRGFRADPERLEAVKVSSIWLTGRGEDFLRQLEADPGVGRPITVAMVMQMGGALTDIAAKVLTEFLAQPR